MDSPPHSVRVTTARVARPLVDPLTAYLALGARFGRDQVYLLESAGGPPGDCGQHVVGFAERLSISVTAGEVQVRGADAVRAAVLARVEPLLTADGTRLRDNRGLWALIRAAESVFEVTGSATGFEFGFLAYFGYDVARYIEDLPHLIESDPGVPDVHLVLYQGLLRTDLVTGDAELLVHTSPAWPDLDLGELSDLLAAAADRPADPGADAPSADEVIEDDTARETYLRHVDKALGHIAIGDIYQVQLGHELSIRSDSDPVRVYRRLRERNASPYMYLTPLGEHTVVGASPELFVRVRDGEVVMRPIAGTHPRGVVDGEPVDDEVAAAALASSPKEIAEHVMLVDLCRNDIGRICGKDTLEVREQMVVERYSHVLHLVSTVVGRAAPGTDSYDVIAALFPSGTMTGAPKIRAMEIIEATEARRRGLYAGAIGLIGAGGYLNLALCIRTLIHSGGVYRTRASAGVVADSDAGREWTETLAKSSAAYWAVTGRELL
ncbi:anthranilate synthase component I family protein [Actinokineospora auranticolor]|uniref:Anthranilate synthase component 1 n=1 Tax=Actinokineospora auranticolor TaxID=155976 RepID=A0A2S6GD60_9PSEU|nr:anthranilate synthase component I family protein [Actinokineospora auranticolor]PPK63142.1 anthranilate synthase component 1 [Actinokineospora auranticolor]